MCSIFSSLSFATYSGLLPSAQWSSPFPWSLTYSPDIDQHFESSMSSANSTFFFLLPAKKKEVALCISSMKGFNTGNEKLTEVLEDLEEQSSGKWPAKILVRSIQAGGS